MENKKKTLLKQYIDFFETIPTDYGFDNQEAEKLTEFWRHIVMIWNRCQDP